MSQVRINKYISLCGVSSRRGADELITEGRIKVNDKAVEEHGRLVDLECDVVKFDGVEIKPVEQKVYVLLNKPTKTMTTLHDPFKRRTVVDYLTSMPTRVYPVGRLDYDTEGALVLTNDGDLAFRLTHPRYGVAKIYEALVKDRFSKEKCLQIGRGLKLDDGAVGRAQVSILGFSSGNSRLRLILTEGRKREVRQLCKLVGHPVMHLRRVEFAGINLKNLGSGKCRELTQTEVESLRKLVGITEPT